MVRILDHFEEYYGLRSDDYPDPLDPHKGLYDIDDGECL